MRLPPIQDTEKKIGRIHAWGSSRSVDRSEHHSQHNCFDKFIYVWWMEVQTAWMGW
jgi:hypothetical protein